MTKHGGGFTFENAVQFEHTGEELLEHDVPTNDASAFLALDLSAEVIPCFALPLLSAGFSRTLEQHRRIHKPGISGNLPWLLFPFIITFFFK